MIANGFLSTCFSRSHRPSHTAMGSAPLVFQSQEYGEGQRSLPPYYPPGDPYHIAITAGRHGMAVQHFWAALPEIEDFRADFRVLGQGCFWGHLSGNLPTYRADR